MKFLLWMCWWILSVWPALPLWAAAPIRVVDDRGAVVSLHVAPRRIVSLLPSLTEMVCDLGACARLVATDRWSNWPEAVKRLPKLGGLDDPHVELIVAQRPDLVLLAPSSRLAQRLRSLGLTVAELDATDLPGVQRVMQQVAALLGQPEQAAVRWQALQQQIKQAQRLVPHMPHRHPPRVYFEVSSTPFAAGASSYIGQLLAQLGAANVVPAAMGPFPQINPEFVVRADPNVVMLSAQDAAQIKQRPGWASMSAVHLGRVCALSEAQMDVLARPGPRLGVAAMVLAQCLQRHGAPAGVSP